MDDWKNTVKEIKELNSLIDTQEPEYEKELKALNAKYKHLADAKKKLKKVMSQIEEWANNNRSSWSDEDKFLTEGLELVFVESTKPSILIDNVEETVKKLKKVFGEQRLQEWFNFNISPKKTKLAEAIKTDLLSQPEKYGIKYEPLDILEIRLEDE